MTPEAACFLLKARDYLLKAREMLEHWPDEAGRASYLAVFHAARGLIFDNTGQVVRHHAAVQAQFSRLVGQDPDGAADAHLFLGRAYNFRFVAEHEAGSAAEPAPDHAALVVDEADRVVAYVTKLLVA